MGISKLTLLGYALMGWSSVIGLVGVAWGALGAKYAHAAVVTAGLGATGGLVLCIIGAARHEDY